MSGYAVDVPKTQASMMYEMPTLSHGDSQSVLRYEILGPLRVIDSAGVSFISAPKIEILLAVLLIRSDQVVAISQLMGEIWGEKPPRRATTSLHVYVSQLRKFLARPGRADSPIVTRPPGYMLRRGGDELDVEVFQRLIDQGRSFARAGRHEDASRSFESALGLWRGPALSDLRESPVVNGFVTWLEEARLECTEMLIESDLILGRHRENVVRLSALTAEHPLRETFYRQLMLALYRSERQADALRVYQTARQTLDDELGLEPCRALRDLHRAILLGGSGLDLGGEVDATAAAGITAGGER
jgi:DNA-binding SARP family transcriptional activator